jgi:hypothetical protein
MDVQQRGDGETLPMTGATAIAIKKSRGNSRAAGADDVLRFTSVVRGTSRVL